jgi:hypothetical protein
VAIEQGGIGYFWFMVQFVVDQTGKVVQEGRIEFGPANGSQPIRAETNRASAAAGSRR